MNCLIAFASRRGFLLLLLAALSVVYPHAQNAVGYVNKTLPPGFALLTNPLLSNDNTVGNILKNIQGGVPHGLAVHLLDENGSFKTAFYDSSTESFLPAEVAAEEIPPGRGFFLCNPTTQILTATFAGTVLQGTLVNPLHPGFNLVGSMVPRAATPEQLDLPAEPGDRIYFFDPATQNFQVSIYDDLDNQWSPALRALEAGEAFVVYKGRAADWIQEFSINQAALPELAFPMAFY